MRKLPTDAVGLNCLVDTLEPLETFERLETHHTDFGPLNNDEGIELEDK